MPANPGTELQRLQSDYEAYYDLLPDAVLVHADGKWMYANRAACALFGASSRDELIGRDVFEIVPAELRETVRARAASVVAGAKTDAVEQRLLRLDGTEIYAEVSGVPSTTRDGRAAVLVTMRDVSARLELTRRFRATFEQSAVGMAHVGSDGRWLRVNAHLCAMLGYSREELQSLTFRDVMYPPDLALDEIAIVKLITHEIDVYASEKRYVRKDGSLIWTNVTVSVVHTSDGGVDYFLAVAEDISKRKAAEEDLARREERWRHLVQQGADIILLIDPSGRIEFASESLQRILGYSPDELTGMNVFELMHAEDVPRLTGMHDGLLQTRRSVITTVRLKSKNDGWRLVDGSAVNLLDDPSVAAIVINAHDVTERTRLAGEVEQLKRVESLGRVAASVAHELNNVLMSFQAAAMRAEKTGADEKFHATLKRTLARGKSITSDILRFSQPAQMMRERTSFAGWLTDTLHDLEPLLGTKHGVQLSLDEGTGDVAIDRRQMAQVVTNLVLNARDAMPDGGAIEVGGRHSHERHDEILLTVSDRGTGIDEAMFERIFEPLFTTKANGTGLGLPIVQQIVLRHGGSISVESEKRRGTTFTIALPRA